MRNILITAAETLPPALLIFAAVYLIARIWRAAGDAGPLHALARALLGEYDRSNRSLLRRLKRMKQRQMPRED